MMNRFFRIAALWLTLASPVLASQATLVTPGPPLSMTTLASFLNSALLSIGSCNSGNSAPTNGTGGTAFAGQCWINTTTNPWVFSYTADGTHWSEFGTLNTSSFVWTSYSTGWAENLGGAFTTAAALTQAGAFPTTITSTGTTNSTLPVGTHTLAGLDVNQAFSGTDNFTGPFQINGNAMTFPGVAATLGALGVAQTWTATQTFSGTVNHTGPFQIGGTAQTFPASGSLAGVTDAQTLTNKTFNCANNTCTVRLGSDVTGNLSLSNLATGTSDTVLGYWGVTGVGALAINDCSNALTYSTSTHTFGCNSSAGTGTLTASTPPSANQVGVFTSSTNMQGVGPGSVGQSLRSNGSGSAPSYQSGEWVLLKTLTASASASLSDTTSLTSTYTEYEIVFEDIVAATGATSCQLQVHSGGSYQAASYVATASFAGSASGQNQVTTNIPCGVLTSQSTTMPSHSVLRINNPSTSSIHAWTGYTTTPSGTVSWVGTLGGVWNSAAVIDGFQVLMSSGNIASGKVKIYGRL